MPTIILAGVSQSLYLPTNIRFGDLCLSMSNKANTDELIIEALTKDHYYYRLTMPYIDSAYSRLMVHAALAGRFKVIREFLPRCLRRENHDLNLLMAVIVRITYVDPILSNLLKHREADANNAVAINDKTLDLIAQTAPYDQRQIEKLVAKIIRSGCSPINQTYHSDDIHSNNYTALMIAAEYGLENVVNSLLAAGADRTIKNAKDNKTACELAVDMLKVYEAKREIYSCSPVFANYINNKIGSYQRLIATLNLKPEVQNASALANIGLFASDSDDDDDNQEFKTPASKKIKMTTPDRMDTGSNLK